MEARLLKRLIGDMANRIASEQVSLLKIDFMIDEVDGEAHNEVCEILSKAYFELNNVCDLLRSIK